MPISIDQNNKLILITSPTTAVTAQELHDAVEDFMASPIGMVTDGSNASFRGDILKPEGKIEDPGNPGVYSQIILNINPEWQIQYWGGSGYTRISGGKLVGGVSSQPIKATGTAGDITVLETQVDGTIVAVGSGLTATQAAQLEELHRDVGLDDANPKTVTENTPDVSYDETATGITKQVRKSGSVTTITRT